MPTHQRKKYAVCVDNEGYKASLEVGKVYRVLDDADAAKHAMVRVIDEDGEDYLYPLSFFSSVAVSARIAEAIGH